MVRTLPVLVLFGFATVAAGAAEAPRAANAPGYTIPLIDLATQKDRQVVVDREQGQYLGHPATVLLEDGKTMIAVYPKGHGRGAIVMKRSADGGLTWSDRLATPANWASSRETPTLHRVVDMKGNKRLILFSGLYPIRMARSSDDGASWSPLEPIGDFGGIVAMASVERLRNGDYLALFHDDGRYLRKEGVAAPFRVFKTVSKDGGLTWAPPQVIATHPTAHLCEPGLIRAPDGRQIAVLLRENSRKHNSFVIFSDDEGTTWTEPRELPGALTGDRHVGKYAPDGRLFVSFRDTTRESPTAGDWVGWVGTYDDIAQGREGQYRVRLVENHKGSDCAYPGVVVLADGTIVATTYGHWEQGEAPFVVSVRFKLAELDEMAKKRSKTGTGGAGRRGPFDPTDQYEAREVEGWGVLVHRDFLAKHPDLAERTLMLLRYQLYETDRRLPAGPLKKLRTVRIWVEENEPHHAGLVYHPDPGWLRENGMNPEKARCVEVSNARNFLNWSLEQPFMVLHELAHAYHHQFIANGFDNTEVKAAYERAVREKLYESVLHINGKQRQGYAVTNPMEYFAESSEAYFGTNDFFPYVRSELRRHDPGMFELLRRVWDAP